MTQKSNDPGILPDSHWTNLDPVEIEEGPDSKEDAESILTSTASITSSLLRFRSLHGRTFHSELGNAQAWEPNDRKHIESLDLLHASYLLAMDGKLHFAPLEFPKVKKVLDLGTGAGHWAIDFGDLHPDVEVIGTDITPIQPTWVPPNVSFQIDDATREWTFSENTFDFIHIRFLLGCVIDWDALYQQAFRCLKPGGWIEHQEVSAHWYSEKGIDEDSPLGQYPKIYREAGNRMGRTFMLYEDEIQKKGMEAAGFTDIHVRDIKVPFGDWPEDEHQREIGLITKAGAMADLDGWIIYVLNEVLGWQPEASQVFLAHVRRQLREPGLNLYWMRRIVYARKPETS